MAKDFSYKILDLLAKFHYSKTIYNTEKCRKYEIVYKGRTAYFKVIVISLMYGHAANSILYQFMRETDFPF